MPSPHCRLARRAAVAAALAGLLLGPALSDARADEVDGEATAPVIYKWVDENGIAHYTTDRDRIPSELRGTFGGLRGLGEEEPPAAATPSDAWAVQDARRARDPYAIRLPGDDGFGSIYDDEGNEVAATGETVAAPGSADRELEERISALEAEIARDQETLKSLLSDASGPDDPALVQRPEFREIATRLPRLQASLRTLRRQRSAPQDL